MNADCTAAREWLLEAELADVRAGVGPHAQHIRSCATCSAAARTLLRGYQRLDEGLDALVPKTATPVSHRRWLLWAPAPLAAAALLALMLGHHEKQPAAPSPLLAQLMLPETPIVTPPAGKQAVVMEKSDLTVVWLY